MCKREEQGFRQRRLSWAPRKAERRGGEKACNKAPRQACLGGGQSSVSLWVWRRPPWNSSGLIISFELAKATLTGDTNLSLPGNHQHSEETLNDFPSIWRQTSAGQIVSFPLMHTTGPLHIPAWQPLLSQLRHRPPTSHASTLLSRVLSGSPGSCGLVRGKLNATPGWLAQGAGTGSGAPRKGWPLSSSPSSWSAPTGTQGRGLWSPGLCHAPSRDLPSKGPRVQRANGKAWALPTSETGDLSHPLGPRPTPSRGRVARCSDVSARAKIVKGNPRGDLGEEHFIWGGGECQATGRSTF